MYIPKQSPKDPDPAQALSFLKDIERIRTLLDAYIEHAHNSGDPAELANAVRLACLSAFGISRLAHAHLRLNPGVVNAPQGDLETALQQAIDEVVEELRQKALLEP
ncbi:MAG: hypothetical protein HPY76_00210 [Anaerolineae bacterium]|nr:hypothetical protein [Anaerolineae bacterium]